MREKANSNKEKGTIYDIYIFKVDEEYRLKLLKWNFTTINKKTLTNKLRSFYFVPMLKLFILIETAVSLFFLSTAVFCSSTAFKYSTATSVF